jgi:hypothetical protein
MLAGCAGQSEETTGLVRAAWHERETASARLNKAIATYCARESAVLEARIHCVQEQRMSVLQALAPNGTNRRAATELTWKIIGAGEDKQPMQWVACERTPFVTSCTSVHPPLLLRPVETEIVLRPQAIVVTPLPPAR